jgi:hypothetical protein
MFHGVMWHPMHARGWPHNRFSFGESLMHMMYLIISLLFKYSISAHSSGSQVSHVGSIFVANLLVRHVTANTELQTNKQKTGIRYLLSHLIMLLQKIVTNYARHGSYYIYNLICHLKRHLKLRCGLSNHPTFTIFINYI